MADEIIAALSEFSLHVVAKMMGKAIVSEPVGLPEHRTHLARTTQLDKTALANAVLDSCIDQASEIVTKLGIVSQLNDERGDFGLIVGIIAREQLSLIEYLTGNQLLLIRDCSRSVGESCMRAVRALRE